MTKENLQKEILEKVKPGTKPSDIKKLKRSKSDGDIPRASPLPNSVPLSKSQSQEETPLTQPNQKQTVAQLQEQVRFHAETAQNYLKSLQVSQAKISELEEKLKNKPLTQSEELDQSLIARHQNLKDWFKQYEKSKELDKELSENVEEASEELIRQDQVISGLRSQVIKLKNEKENLAKDLQLASRLAEMRKRPFSSPEYPFLKYAFYSLVTALFMLWLTNNLKNNQ